MKTSLDEMFTMLIAVRRQLNISQAEMAERMGVTQGTIGNIETRAKENAVFYSTALRYADALGVDVHVEIVTPKRKQRVEKMTRLVDVAEQLDEQDERLYLAQDAEPLQAAPAKPQPRKRGKRHSLVSPELAEQLAARAR